ncbi:hypothetical protein B0H12DRAFT_1235448 [Mycena haematopus]|nr:hypothetical protein B0H12DRAFT_1235448 [Mycena haematopus]
MLTKLFFLANNLSQRRAEFIDFNNASASGTPACLKFTGFIGSQGVDMKSDEPSSKKRKTADDRAVEEVDDKGEGTSTQGRRLHKD